MGLTASQISQIQSDQAAVETAIQANSSPVATTTSSSSTTTSSSSTTTSSSSSSSASPTSIASVDATMQSVQPYLVDLPGVGPMIVRSDGVGMGVGGPGIDGGIGRSGGPVMITRAVSAIGGGSGSGHGLVAKSGSGVGVGVGASGGPIMISRGSLDIGGGLDGSALGGQNGPVFVQNTNGGPGVSSSAGGSQNGPMLVQNTNGGNSAVGVSALNGGFGMGGGGLGTIGGGWR